MGKRTQRTCRLLFNEFEDIILKLTPENKLEIYSDGHEDYKTILLEYFDTNSINYGLLIKIKEKGILVDKQKEIIFGNPKMENIGTTNVECFNTILRGRLLRLTRKTQCHAKNKYQMNNNVRLFQFYWNFIKPIERKESPAMKEKLTNKLWTWGKFLHTNNVH